MSIEAVNPEKNATIFASAGTGKTWMLVSRILRLLLDDVRPDAILAITFTKKAAGEMYLRLLQRLEEWSCCTDESLRNHLKSIGCRTDDRQLQFARQLYEQILMSPYPLRISTFHAFCNDLLTQFPIEAGLPPGYEIIDEARAQELRELSFSKMMTEASANPDSSLAQSLKTLLARCGATSTQTALNAFLQHRSDWWAWTEKADQPLQWANDEVRKIFTQTDASNLLKEFFSNENHQKIRQLATGLSHPAHPKTKRDLGNKLSSLLETDSPQEEKFSDLCSIMLLRNGELRKFSSPSKATRKKIDEASLINLETEWYDLIESCQDVLDKIKQQKNLNLNLAWYEAGSYYLDLYQDNKHQNRQLDYPDQEWLAYRLLTAGIDMLWVQFKLDQRIEHLLVDEFQDTNPTQWRLLLPLLEEFAASRDDQRSVFLVGDEKQSIYAFRRANPKLQAVAAQWLENRLASQRYTMTLSYRSAPAIMDIVNRVFTESRYAEQLPDFSTHSTIKEKLWGRIEILPAFKVEPDTINTETAFRNPLLEPRPETEKAQQAEAEAIANRIRSLIDDAILIEDDEKIRPVQYGDIKILLRKRTHSHYLERALRAQKIPYQGTSRGGLLQTQEISDIKSLLTVLHTPQDNLALARVLVSPLFSASQEDLIRIAEQSNGAWFDRLQLIAESCADEHPISQAVDKLKRWQQDSQLLPLHDLLNQIYFEANVLARYRAAAELWRQPQIETNLKRLVTLALEIDSGRYPSMNHFLMRLSQLQQAGNDAPSELTPDYQEQPVEILTVHAAKGLEAPVIFLANMGVEKPSNSAWDALINWPADQETPQQFLLQPVSSDRDKRTAAVLEKWQQKLEREKANLLYVALTRARQMMIISASESTGKTSSASPHAELLETLKPMGVFTDEGVWVYETGDKPAHSHSQPPLSGERATGLPIPGLNHTIQAHGNHFFEIAPSQSIDEDETGGEKDGRQRGTGIHIMLDKITTTDWNSANIRRYTAARMELPVNDLELGAWYEEAQQVITQNPDLFEPGRFLKSWNELPVVYQQGKQQVYGIIDRLIEYNDYYLIIDYKTHRNINPEDTQVRTRKYLQQITYYQQGIEKLWRNKPVTAAILWTATNQLQAMEQVMEIEK